MKSEKIRTERSITVLSQAEEIRQQQEQMIADVLQAISEQVLLVTESLSKLSNQDDKKYQKAINQAIELQNLLTRINQIKFFTDLEKFQGKAYNSYLQSLREIIGDLKRSLVVEKADLIDSVSAILPLATGDLVEIFAIGQ